MADILVPTLGESVTEATVAKWLKQPGDAVEKDEPLLELETDKVTLEVNAPAAGVLESIEAAEEQDVGVGALLGVIAEGASAGKAAPKAAAAPQAKTEAAPAPAPAAAASGAVVDVPVPTLGESVTSATVATWHKSVGDAVAQDETICELETDKVTLEVNAPVAGVIHEILAEVDADVEVGAMLARITEGAAGASAAPAAKAVAAPAGKTAAASAPAGATPNGSGANGAVSKDDLIAYLEEGQAPSSMTMSPAVARLVREHDLNPNLIKGTGKHGGLTKKDVLAFLENPPAPRTLPSAPAPSAAPAAPVAAAAPVASATAQPAGERERRERMPKMRQTIARRLKEAQNTAAMLTTFNEIDMSAVMELRKSYKDTFEKKHGVKLGFNSFFAKAVVQALEDVPAINARIDGDEIVYNQFFDIGMAVSTPTGLMVPVLRDCDSKSFADIEANLGELAKRGRDGKLGMDDMMGGSFTITNGGVFGSLLSTPILNMPQSGILGLHKIEERPVAVNGQVVIRPMMYVALSYDHRLVDGREAVTFLVRVKECIEDPQRLLLSM